MRTGVLVAGPAPQRPVTRLNVGARVAGAEVNVIATWPDGVDVADLEEAIKQAARAAITTARTRTRAHQ